MRVPLELRWCEFCGGVRVNADCASFAGARCWFGVRSCMLFGSCAASLCLSVGDAIAFCAIISAADMRGREKSERAATCVGDSDRSDSSATAEDAPGLGSREVVTPVTAACGRGRSGSPERPQPGGGWLALSGCSTRMLGGHSVRPLLRNGGMTATTVLSAATSFLVFICARGDGMGDLCGCVEGGDGCRADIGADGCSHSAATGERRGRVVQLLHRGGIQTAPTEAERMRRVQ